MKTLISLLLVTVLTGCATSPKEAKTDIAGYYAMTKGGFNESMSSELAADGSYVLDHELFACVIGPNGEMPITYSREEGTWRFEGGMILLGPIAQTKDFPVASVFVPALAHRPLPDGYHLLRIGASGTGASPAWSKEADGSRKDPIEFGLVITEWCMKSRTMCSLCS